jgi:1,5-anhydro-D-fructose reductase (1,5-anhydro-D-mannitol-forming)
LTIRWGMIGVGSVAEHKSGPAFLHATGGSLQAVASRRHEAALNYAARHGVAHVFASPRDLIASDLVDAVYIATPPASHLPLALEVAKAGKPCCVEKPMAIYLRDAETLCRAFDDAGVPLFVSYYRRSLPRFAAVAQAIAGGAIGPVASVTWTLGRVGATPVAGDNWRLDPSEAPGGLFEDLACHGLDLFDSLFGPITHIDESQLRVPAGSPVPDRVEARWHHGAAIEGHGTWDFGADARADTIVVTGEHGAIRFAMFDETPVEIRSQSGTITHDIPNPKPIQLPHVIALNRALGAGVPHPSTGHSALRTARVSEAILRGPGVRVERA